MIYTSSTIFLQPIPLPHPMAWNQATLWQQYLDAWRYPCAVTDDVLLLGAIDDVVRLWPAAEQPSKTLGRGFSGAELTVGNQRKTHVVGADGGETER